MVFIFFIGNNHDIPSEIDFFSEIHVDYYDSDDFIDLQSSNQWGQMRDDKDDGDLLHISDSEVGQLSDDEKSKYSSRNSINKV